MELTKLKADQIGMPSWYSTEPDLRKFNNLKSSIRMFGLLQPIVVCKLPDSERYIIAEGKRKFLACVELGMKDIDCVVIEKNPILANMMLNKIKFDIDNIGFSEMVSTLKKEIPLHSLCNYIPFSSEILKGFDKLHNFDWSEFDKEADSIKQISMFDEEGGTNG